ncbi:uncharacterized protein LOC62_07G009532 [Vanrija pseudolonga]|uniref:Uncharacterized protein n=1 Tax=Vanrija pseudolonga TaxID=143232 RepID=A0AAF0YI23_9TREE|nr:hypothetical protein LOC62_07G009532 [Vanrija pseudolonga]
MSLRLPIQPATNNIMEHYEQDGDDEGYGPVAGPSTHALQAITAELEQLTISQAPTPATGTRKPLQAEEKRYHVHETPQRQSSGNRFWVVGDPAQPTSAGAGKPAAGAAATTPPRRPPALSVLTATEFAELRTTLQRAYLPGAGGMIAAEVAKLAHFTESGRHAGRFVGVRVPACVAANGPVVLGQQLCRVLGYLDRLVASTVAFDPPQQALGIVKASLATCIPLAAAEEAERGSWMDWAAERNIRTLIIGQLLHPQTQHAADTFTHLALGISGMCTRSMIGRDGKKWFVTLLPGLESHRGRRVPGEVGRPLPPKVVAARLAEQNRLANASQAAGGSATPAPQPRRRRVRAIAKKTDEAGEKQPGAGSEGTHEGTAPDAASATAPTVEVDQNVPSATDATSNHTVAPEPMLQDDKENEADDEDDNDDERTLLDHADDGGVQLGPIAHTPARSPRTPYAANIDDAQPVSRPGSTTSSELGSPRPLSPLTDLSESSSDGAGSRPLALMRRLNSSTGTSPPRSSSGASVPLAYVRRRNSNPRNDGGTAGVDNDAALSADHEASDHSTTSSILSSTTSSPSSYGKPVNGDGHLSSVGMNSESEDVPLAVVRRRTSTAKSPGHLRSSSVDVPLAEVRRRTTSAESKDNGPARAPPKHFRTSSSRNHANKRRSLGSTSEDEPLALARALEKRFRIADNDMGHGGSSAIPPLPKRRAESVSLEKPVSKIRAQRRQSRAAGIKSAEEKPVLPTQSRRTSRRVGAAPTLRAPFDMDTSSDDQRVPLSLALRRRYANSTSEDEPLGSGTHARKRSISSSSGDNEPLSTQLRKWRKKQRRTNPEV